MKIAGIEEAGRGPVIGPMVMVGLLVREENEKHLREIGVKDSKMLSPRQREELYKEIMQYVEKYEIVILEPKDIDDAVLSRTSNLNHLEADTTIRIINKLNPNKAILDCPSTNTVAYANEIRKGLRNESIIIQAEHKADVKYPIVSAASIIAKVTRDKEVAKLQKQIVDDIGSGYPADPRTQDFLKRNYNNPKLAHIFRKSWASYKNMQTKRITDF